MTGSRDVFEWNEIEKMLTYVLFINKPSGFFVFYLIQLSNTTASNIIILLEHTKNNGSLMSDLSCQNQEMYMNEVI